jgi:prefoldin beta subunit
LADDANIYKLVGPVLLKQDTSEAKSTVDGRLEYIGGEMYVTARLHRWLRILMDE